MTAESRNMTLLAQHELPALPLESARHLIGRGAVALLKRGFEAAGAEWDEGASPALLKAFLVDYLERNPNALLYGKGGDRR